MGTSLNLLRVWASTGAASKPSDAKIDLGWLAGEQPPNEYENERMNTRDTRINEIITYLNAGVPLDDILAGDAIVDNSSIQITNTATNGEVYLERAGVGFKLVTEGSTVLSKQTVAVDVSGSSWALLRTITTTTSSMYVHRVSAAIDFKQNGVPNADTKVIDIALYDGTDVYKAFYSASGAVQVDQLDVVTYSATPPTFGTMLVEVASVTAAQTPIP